MHRRAAVRRVGVGQVPDDPLRVGALLGHVVRAERHVVHAHQGDHVLQRVQVVVERRAARLAVPDDLREGRHADHTATRGHRFHHVVRKRTRPRNLRRHADVRHDARLLGHLDGVERRLDAGVAQVHRHPDAPGFLDQPRAEVREAGVVRFEAAVAHEVALVVRELQHAQAKPMEHLEPRQVVADDARVLAPHDDREPTGRLGRADVVRRIRDAAVRVPPDRVVVLLDPRDALQRVVHRQRHGEVRRREARFPEDRAVPVEEEGAAVDDDRRRVQRARLVGHVGGPAGQAVHDRAAHAVTPWRCGSTQWVPGSCFGTRPYAQSPGRTGYQRG